VDNDLNYKSRCTVQALGSGEVNKDYLAMEGRRINEPTGEDIANVMTKNDYRIYDTPGIDWNLNIAGMRSSVLTPDKFDDLLVVFHRFGGRLAR
jgi:hypothetical protein